MATYTLHLAGGEVQIEVPGHDRAAVDEFTQQVQGGWGAASDAELQRAADEIAAANRIAAMDMDQYAAERKRLGLSRDLGQFLSGN